MCGANHVWGTGLADDNTVKLLDFGSARILQHSENATETFVMTGECGKLRAVDFLPQCCDV